MNISFIKVTVFSQSISVPIWWERPFENILGQRSSADSIIACREMVQVKASRIGTLLGANVGTIQNHLFVMYKYLYNVIQNERGPPTDTS